MILSKGRTLEVPLGELKRRRSRADHEDRASTLEAVERIHILRVLDETNWTLGGPRGAAARLGMKRTTLQSMIKRLGITRPRAAYDRLVRGAVCRGRSCRPVSSFSGIPWPPCFLLHGD